MAKEDKICYLCDKDHEHSHFTYDFVPLYRNLEKKYINLLDKHAALLTEYNELGEKLIRALEEKASLEAKLKKD